MAKPQLENGYLKISNELAEALAGIRIPGECGQVLWVILRKTYGFNKKEDWISLSQFCLLTNMAKTRVCHSIAKLRSINIIIANNSNGKHKTYRFNKDFDTWKPLPKKATKKSIAKYGNKSLPIIGHTKDNIQKTIYPMPSASGIISPLQGKEISLTNNIKPMKKYNENEHQDDGLPELDNETGEIRKELPKKNVLDSYKLLLKWAEARRSADKPFRFTAPLKQYKAFKVMKEAGITPPEIQERWKELEEAPFYEDKGFDFQTVLSSFNKKR